MHQERNPVPAPVGRPRKSEGPTGIRVRHSTYCPARHGGDCTAKANTGKRCRPSYEASVYDAVNGKVRQKTFPTVSAARGWRTDMLSLAQHGKLPAQPSALTLRAAWEDWIRKAS